MLQLLLNVFIHVSFLFFLFLFITDNIVAQWLGLGLLRPPIHFDRLTLKPPTTTAGRPGQPGSAHCRGWLHGRQTDRPILSQAAGGQALAFVHMSRYGQVVYYSAVNWTVSFKPGQAFGTG